MSITKIILITRTNSESHYEVSSKNFIFKMKAKDDQRFISYYPTLVDTNEPAKNLKVTVKLQHFNTNMCKCLFDLLKDMKQKRMKGIDVRVEWFYDSFDRKMLELGEDFSNLVSLPFVFVSQFKQL